ncbi:MAG: ribonuclease H [Anaerovoracaceae bacterium]
MTVLKLYTDGACSGNQNEENLGGWGAILAYGEHEKELFGGEKNTTNNRMEMTALLMALRAIKKENQTIEIYSDSSYLMDCFRKKWYVNWLRNGWQTSAKKPVENKDLWEALLPFLDCHQLSFYRVKGHVNLDHPSTNEDKLYAKFKEWNGNQFSQEDFRLVTAMNNRADHLANQGIDLIR